MSLDVYLESPRREVDCECERCGNRHKRMASYTIYRRNITHNLGRMAGEAGIYEAMWRPEEIGATIARDIAGRLRDGLAELHRDPDKFKAFNPENGWGSYEGLVSFVEEYLAACDAYPSAVIRVSR